MAAAESGYVYQIDIYTGKKDKPELGMGESVVMKLTEVAQDSNCVIGMDNFFTSIQLLKMLHARGIRAIGTLRSS